MATVLLRQVVPVLRLQVPDVPVHLRQVVLDLRHQAQVVMAQELWKLKDVGSSMHLRTCHLHHRSVEFLKCILAKGALEDLQDQLRYRDHLRLEIDLHLR